MNKSGTREPFKPYKSSVTGVCLLRHEPTLKDNPTLTIREQKRGQTAPAAIQQSSVLDTSNKIHQVVSNTKDTVSIMKESSELSYKLNHLRNASSQLKVSAEFIHVREVTQLVAFLDDFTAVIKIRVMDLQIVKFSTNIDAVMKNIQELNNLVDSKLKQFGALIAEAASWLNKQLKLVPSRIGGRIGDLEGRIASILTKVPKAQLVLKGSWLGAIGLGFSLAQVVERGKEHIQDPDSKEKLDKYIIEIIGVVVGVVLLIIGIVAALVGGTVGLIVAAALLIYGIVNMVFGFNDHQDLIAEGTYWLYEEIKSLTQQLISGIEGLLVQAGQAINRVYNYLKDELDHWINSSIESIEAYVSQKVNRMLTPTLWL